MNEVISIETTEQGEQRVRARELWEGLKVKTPFKDWFPRMVEYGFSENKDFSAFLSESRGGRPAKEYLLSIGMAKEIAMIQRTERGKQIRQYFIEVEKKARAQLSMNDWYLIEDEKELREVRKSKNARNYAMKLNAETRQMEARLKIAERVSDPIVRQRLINQLGYQMLEA